MCRGEQRAHDRGRSLVVGADHDAIRMKRVVDRAPFAQELRVRHHSDVGPAEELFHEKGGADGNRRLVDHDRLTGQVWPDLRRHGLEGAHVGRAVGTPGSRHAQEHETGSEHRGGCAHHEPQAAGVQPLRQHPPRPSSTIVGSPRDRRRTLSGSTSPQHTRCPRWARQTAVE